jgi:putative endonuclease
MLTHRRQIGDAAEEIAARFLRSNGLRVLERNFRSRLGELDLIAIDGDVLVIAEVRSRASNAYGGAAASVDGRKQRRLIRTAAQLLQQRRELATRRVRFDVLVVSGIPGDLPQIEWIRHAFTA